jgi:pyruvate/2-oxoglutarate dehydrogenase complex dihydrolipoamide acyltransferase (E2) component
MESYLFKNIPRSRIATFDIYAVGQSKHHISILLECDVTVAREKLKQRKAAGESISFTAWLLKAISQTLTQHVEAAAFLYKKSKLIIFNDVNISTIVEKEVNGQKVPIPLVIAKTNEKSILEIATEIAEAKKQTLSATDVVINEKPSTLEGLYYRLPGFLRRSVWRWMLRNPKFAYQRMGNVVVTSVGMMGQIKGWFIHKSIHPLSFGVGSVLKKPVVVDDEIKIREMLHLTVLIDHDVMDGAPMARFVKALAQNIETGAGL